MNIPSITRNMLILTFGKYGMMIFKSLMPTNYSTPISSQSDNGTAISKAPSASFSLMAIWKSPFHYADATTNFLCGRRRRLLPPEASQRCIANWERGGSADDHKEFPVILKIYSNKHLKERELLPVDTLTIIILVSKIVLQILKLFESGK